MPDGITFLKHMTLTLVFLGIAAYLALISGLIPANADARPGAFERWAARTSLEATLAREAPKEQAHLPSNSSNLTAGLDIYAGKCAICHGFSDAQSSSIARGLYQKPPQLAKHGVEDDPVGETYWKVKHGIRLTGMPSYTSTLSDKQIWQVSLFLANMDKLPPAIQTHWKSLKRERLADYSP